MRRSELVHVLPWRERVPWNGTASPGQPAGNVSEAKRCYLLFPLQQPLVCMGLEKAISWRSVVHYCKGCSSCFSLYPRLSANECPKRSVVTCCFPCSSPWSAWASKRQYPGEALFIIVKVVQVVFIYVLGISSQGKGKTICGFMGFPLAAWVGSRTFAAGNG